VFGEDVQVVPREDPAALAGAVIARLTRGGRTAAATQSLIDARFRPDAVARQYWDLYATVVRGTRAVS
jgi:hypothetical protein